MRIEQRNHPIHRWLKILCIVANLVILFAMVSSAVFPFQEGGDIAAKYARILESPFNYSVRFVFFSVLSIPAVVILVILAFYTDRGERSSLPDVSGVVFLVPYIIFVSFGYCSQYLIFPYMVKHFGVANFIVYDAWCFTSTASIPYPFALIGYAFYGIGAFFIGYKFLFERGAVRGMAVLLYIQGFFSILAIIFHALHFRHEGEICSIISGALSVPYFVTLYVAGKNRRFVKF